MTVLRTATRVRAGADGLLAAECRLCQIALDQLEGADVESALAAFDLCHPAGEQAHRRTVPRGWRIARDAAQVDAAQ